MAGAVRRRDARRYPRSRIPVRGQREAWGIHGAAQEIIDEVLIGPVISERQRRVMAVVLAAKLWCHASWDESSIATARLFQAGAELRLSNGGV